MLTELHELEDQNAVNNKTSELFHLSRYMGVQLTRRKFYPHVKLMSKLFFNIYSIDLW